jgi:hypothetical protein
MIKWRENTNMSEKQDIISFSENSYPVLPHKTVKFGLFWSHFPTGQYQKA